MNPLIRTTINICLYHLAAIVILFGCKFLVGNELGLYSDFLQGFINFMMWSSCVTMVGYYVLLLKKIGLLP